MENLVSYVDTEEPTTIEETEVVEEVAEETTEEPTEEVAAAEEN